MSTTDTPSSRDLMHRFLFDHTDIRGEIVTLEESYQSVIGNNDYPQVVQRLLGEFVAAISLLSSSLKFDGIITLQARGEGPLPLIMAECDHQKSLRAVAKPNESVNYDDLATASFQELIGDGMLAIIIQPDKGARYQGIVPLESDSLAGCLEHYFAQSEQLPTRFWLEAGESQAAGLMLQMLPQQMGSQEENDEHWSTVTQLASTVKSEELFELDHETILYRLFNEEQTRLFDAEAVRFQCSCSRERSASALVSLGRTEVAAMLAEQDLISIDCQFCHQSYAFGERDMGELFGSQTPKLH